MNSPACTRITTAGLLLVATVLGCSRTVNPDIERGSTYFFMEGHPEIRLSAIGYLDEEDNGVIDISADIVHASLIYRESEGQNTANIEVEIRVTSSDGRNFSRNWRDEMEILREETGIITTQDIKKFEHQFNVPPGAYDIAVAIQDLSSDKRTTRTAETYIPDPEDNDVNLTTIRLLGKDMSLPEPDYQPITTYDVPAVNDSIRFLIQVTNNRIEEPLEVASRLIHYESDNEPARSMSMNNYGASSMAYRGIDYNRVEEIDATRRVLDQSGSVMIEYRFPRPDYGNYRFEVRAVTPDDEELYRGRDFGVKSENYPAIKSPRELAEPLFYLMTPKEYESMLEIEDPDSLKAEVDRFWLSNIGSANRARHVISLYYQRIEEANKQFSSYKEGWKTDQGMIYILFGPPWYIDQRLNEMQWSYAYDRTDPRYNFYFMRPKLRNEFFPFEHYLLLRDYSYYNLQYHQVQLWLTGQILQANM
ncbi:MAG: GWxTD domain-containing protein [Balneolaceae bacterium]